MYLVTRTFQDNGIQRVSGELVVGTGYRTLTKLIELRYLKDAGDSESFRCQLCERAFNSQEALDEHYVTLHPDDVEVTDDDKTPEGTDGDDKSNKEGVKNDEPNNKGKGKSGKTGSNVG